MSDTERMTLTLNLVHGDAIQCQVDIDQVRRRNLASNIEAAMASSYIAVLLNEKLTLVPIHNLESVEISPIQEIMLKGVVTGAIPIDD